ncbi:MAG TPA: hypothetical protein VHC69_21980 [Polyangiaceae bacterium]|nr:hypothetical protein [Polyangiaceae bacterium]
MAAWILGLPFLFWHRWPTITKIYGLYAVAFVIVTRVSHWVLGECFLTHLSRHFWNAGAASASDTDEWFTVRFAKLVFGLTPSHRMIAIGSELLVFVTAAGVLFSLYRHHGPSSAVTRRPS